MSHFSTSPSEDKECVKVVFNIKQQVYVCKVRLLSPVVGEQTLPSSSGDNLVSAKRLVHRGTLTTRKRFQRCHKLPFLGERTGGEAGFKVK